MSKSDEWEAPPEPKGSKESEWEAPPAPKKKLSAVEEALMLGSQPGIDPGTRDALRALMLSMSKTGAAMGQLVTEPFGSNYYREAGKALESDLRSLRERSPLPSGIGEITGTVASMPFPGMQTASGIKGLLQAAGLGGVMSAASASN